MLNFPSISPTQILPDRDNAILLISDLQERLMAAMPPDVTARALRNTYILVEVAKAFGLPVLVSEQYPKGLGPTMAEVKAVLPPEVQPAEKLAFNCCKAPGVLPAIGSRDVILCGAETHICVLQTALDLRSRGNRVYLAADAVCSRAKQNWRLGLDLMRQAGVVIGSTEIYAFSLLQAAGTDQFKRISKLVK